MVETDEQVELETDEIMFERLDKQVEVEGDEQVEM